MEKGEQKINTTDLVIGCQSDRSKEACPISLYLCVCLTTVKSLPYMNKACSVHGQFYPMGFSVRKLEKWLCEQRSSCTFVKEMS